MNKFAKLKIAVLASAMLVTALAAKASIDLFGAPRVVQVSPPTALGTGAATPVTNAVVDLRNYDGVVNLLVSMKTNAAGGVAVLTLYSSVNGTNAWTAVTTAATATSTTVISTNMAQGAGSANFTATNTYFLPGTLTTPTAGTAGFASVYLTAAPFTNSAVVTFTGDGWYSLGLNIDDLNRFMIGVWTVSGTTTNMTGAAIMVGHRSGEVKQ